MVQCKSVPLKAIKLTVGSQVYHSWICYTMTMMNCSGGEAAKLLG